MAQSACLARACYLPSSVRIVLNAQLFSRSQSFRSGGINRVIDFFLRELARDPRGHSFDVFLPELPPPDDPVRQGSLRFHPTGAATGRPPVRILWEQTAFVGQLIALRPHLVHNLAYAAPLAWPGPMVVTMYDVSFLRFPNAFRRGNRFYLTAMTHIAAHQARRLTTISEHARSEIAHFLAVPPQRIDVAYPAVDARFHSLPADRVATFRQAHGLPEQFVFTVGTLEPRKNLVGLLEAYALLPTPRPPLLVAGGAGWRFTPVFETVTRLRLDQDVRFLGFVPEEDLPLWYNAADAFAYPSLYEGFGLPVLEAMACGSPVVTSDASSLPEVAGPAAVTVSPTDTRALADALQSILTDPARRAELRAAGLAQATRFTWSAMTDQIVASYSRAVPRVQ